MQTTKMHRRLEKARSRDVCIFVCRLECDGRGGPLPASPLGARCKAPHCKIAGAHARAKRPDAHRGITCALEALHAAHRGFKIGPTFPLQRSLAVGASSRRYSGASARLHLADESHMRGLTLQKTRHGVEGFCEEWGTEHDGKYLRKRCARLEISTNEHACRR